jgi:predicted nucleic acid-binding protein
MTTAIDTNVFVALWDKDNSLNTLAESALKDSWKSGSLVVSAPVYAELMAFPGRSESFLNSFFTEAGIVVEWNLDEEVWRTAGRAFQKYTARRGGQRERGGRRILADFLIGAHAFQFEYQLLTLDDRLYRAAFPRLSIVSA